MEILRKKWYDFQLSQTDPISQETTEDLIRAAGYVAERHEIKTEDGYWLTVHRIPRGNDQVPEANKSVVILQHGLFGSSASWVLNGINSSLGFILADEGYDVWIPNFRGNTYSKRHEFLDPINDAPRFWNFSFHEMGSRDMPAIIDYILNSTGQLQVSYIGHSMGTTTAFILLSTRPEYNEKIKVCFAMAPIAYLGHIKSPTVKLLITLDPLLKKIFQNRKMYEILPHSKWITYVDEHICRNNSVGYFLCKSIMESLSGFDSAEIDLEIFHKILRHFPAGTSLKVLDHFGQLIKGGKFRQYDYGWKGNYFQYGSIKPPNYELHKIDAPILMFQAQNDWLSDNQDINKLFDELPHIVGKEIIHYKKFNHIDFMFAKDINELLNNLLVNILNRYRNIDKGK